MKLIYIYIYIYIFIYILYILYYIKLSSLSIFFFLAYCLKRKKTLALLEKAKEPFVSEVFAPLASFFFFFIIFFFFFFYHFFFLFFLMIF